MPTHPMKRMELVLISCHEPMRAPTWPPRLRLSGLWLLETICEYIITLARRGLLTPLPPWEPGEGGPNGP